MTGERLARIDQANLSVLYGAYIEASASRLIAAGRIERAPKGRPVTEAVANLDTQVGKLRGDGLTNPQIAEKLGREKTDIEASAHRLIAAGRIERLSKGPRSGESATSFLRILQEFQTAHPTGSVSLSEIAGQLGVSRERARQFYEKLSTTHTLPPKSGGGMKQLSPEYLAKLDQEVTRLTHQGITVGRIAEELHVPAVWVKTSQKRSAPQNQEQEKQDREEFRSQVEQLRNQGVGTNKIAEILGKTRSQVQRIVTRMLRSGHIQKMRQRKSPDELVLFDAQVKKLRAARLTYQEIAQRLGPLVSVSNVLASVQRLRSRGEIKMFSKKTGADNGIPHRSELRY